MATVPNDPTVCDKEAPDCALLAPRVSL